MPDGRIFAHNLTPTLAAVLAEMSPHDETMRARAGDALKSKSKSAMKNEGATNADSQTTNA